MGNVITFFVQKSSENGFEARATGHSIFTQAETFDELKVMVQDAVATHFDPNDRPRIIRLHLVKDEVLAV